MRSLFLLILCLFFGPLQAKDFEDIPQIQNKHVEAIQELNMRSFPFVNQSWSCNSFYEFLTKWLKHEIERHPRHSRDLAFSLIHDATYVPDQPEPDTTIWQDLTLFCGKKQTSPYVAQAINRCKTEVGSATLLYALTLQTTDTTLLRNRQNLIRTMQTNQALGKQISNALASMQKHQTLLLTFWDKYNHFKRNLEDAYAPKISTTIESHPLTMATKNAYATGMSVYNLGYTTVLGGALIAYGGLVLVDTIKTPDALTAWVTENKGAAMGFMSPLWRYTLGNRFVHGSLAIAAGALCLTDLNQKLDQVKGIIFLNKILHQIMIDVAQSVTAMEELAATLEHIPAAKALPELAPLFDFFTKLPELQPELEECLALLDSDDFDREPSYINHIGATARSFLLTIAIKPQLEKALLAAGYVDVYAGCATLLGERNETGPHYCLPDYVDGAPQPFIEANNFWHPIINPNIVVPNSLTLGTASARPHGIITGPNAGGKSTIIKSLILSIIMAQALGIAPAQSLRFTPFASIDTYLNITDDISAGNSLFKAEVKRTQSLVDRIDKADAHTFSLVAFDEVFNGASYIEGTAAAFAVARHLSITPGCICLVATHFPMMTELEQETTTFTNYKVSVEQTRSGGIVYPFKLEPGISHQNIALQILENEGIASSIVSDAKSLLARAKRST
jgi:DNA mismatch repair protein MutS